MDDLIEALTILREYNNDRCPTGCEHDEFRVYVKPSEVSLEKIQRLGELGFDPDEDTESFISYRFGSA